MTILGKIRERIGSMIAAGLFSACFAVIGLILVFVVSPQQAIEWRQIQAMPETDAAAFTAAATGEEIVITGTLIDNAELTAEGYVAYSIDEWYVDPPSDSEDDPDGVWRDLENNAPALLISIPGGTVQTVASRSVNLTGNVEERLEMGSGTYRDSYNGQELPDGTLRTRGVRNGDLVTIIGEKGSSGGIVPGWFFAGDRVQLIDHIRTGARTAFLIGLGMIFLAPVIMVISVLSAVFGKRKGTGIKVMR